MRKLINNSTMVRMNKFILLILFLPGLYPCSNAQEIRKIVLPVLYQDTPLSNGLIGGEEVNDAGAIFNISTAEITVMLPASEEPTSCIIMFPGGAYKFVNIIEAGFRGAEIFNKAGIAVVVVKYRLPNGNGLVPLEDGTQVIRMVRRMAKEWNINPNKIGIYGSSAGGHLASMLSVHWKPANPASVNEWEHYSSRPDFVILVKPVINTAGSGSMKNFAGENPSADKLHFANSLNFISKDCAPAFIVHATNDKAAPVQGSISYYLKLIENGVPAEMHIFGEGGHGGIGFKNKKNPEDEWVNLLLRWKYLY